MTCDCDSHSASWLWYFVVLLFIFVLFLPFLTYRQYYYKDMDPQRIRKSKRKSRSYQEVGNTITLS